jgi:hypothetical protein
VVLPSGTFSADVVESTTWEVSTPGGGALEPDLSLIHLTSAPVGATPLPIATLQQENSFRTKGVTFFGFGHITYLTATQGKTQDGMWSLNGNCPASLATWNIDCFTHHSTSLGEIVPGDSGGAWVGWTEGHWVMLAAETGWNTETGDVTQYGTSVVRWSNWIAYVEANDAPSRSNGSGGSNGSSSAPPPSPPSPTTTYAETSGGATHTWTNYTNAGGTEGPTIASNQTVQISCALQGFKVADGNTWWYQIASSPWNNAYYASADAFYNNGATSGSLSGTPFVDPAVAVCGSSSPAPAPTPPAVPATYAETVGGPTNTWTDYSNAGGTQGPTIASNQTVQIACTVPGFKVADGNTSWYRIASSPWNNAYYASADAFYNNGATSGSLSGTPFVDPKVPAC